MTGGLMSQLEAPFRLPEMPVEADLVAKYFRGLGEPTRLRILELLRDEGELSVGELVKRLGVPQPKVSNHLACLRWCGFIEARREHRHHARLARVGCGERAGRARGRNRGAVGSAVTERARGSSWKSRMRPLLCRSEARTAGGRSSRSCPSPAVRTTLARSSWSSV